MNTGVKPGLGKQLVQMQLATDISNEDADVAKFDSSRGKRSESMQKKETA
jgi:hypothetical protein